MILWHHLQHWLAVHTGTVNEAGPYYGFWSGFGSDIGEIALLGGVFSLFRHQNCGVKHCWRLSRHEYKMDGITHRLCRKHHPAHSGSPVTAAEIEDHYSQNAT